MADLRQKWFLCIVERFEAEEEKKDDGTAALLLDRRLVRTKGARITSFVAGTVAIFLQKDFLPDCEVLRDVPGEKLEQLRVLLNNAVPNFGARAAAATLLFLSTRDGATAAAFHKRCDAKGPTLTLIKDTDGNVFGGYTQENWSSKWKYVSDPAAFLISVVSPHGTPPVLFPSTGGNYSIGCNSLCGPIFGDGVVLGGFMGDLCFTCNSGSEYVNPTGRRAEEVMTGRLNFRPAIVEVYSF